MAGPWKKVELINPNIIPVDVHRNSVKYGKSMGSKVVREFYFDIKDKKYHYLKSGKEVFSKSMNLKECQYDIEARERSGPEKWDDDGVLGTYRFVMRFNERQKRPIFVYSSNLEILHGLKNFGVFCQIIDVTIPTKHLKQVLSILSYTSSAFILRIISRVYDHLHSNTNSMGRIIKSFIECNNSINQGMRGLLLGFANSVYANHRRFSPHSIIGSVLDPQVRIEYPDEAQIIKSAKFIVSTTLDIEVRLTLIQDLPKLAIV